MGMTTNSNNQVYLLDRAIVTLQVMCMSSVLVSCFGVAKKLFCVRASLSLGGGGGLALNDLMVSGVSFFSFW
jgi:hypothetical protein